MNPAPDSIARLEHDRISPRTGQGASGGKASQACSDDDDIGVGTDGRRDGGSRKAGQLSMTWA
jgi:hypothetical protein